jgi:uncharacterized protein
MKYLLIFGLTIAVIWLWQGKRRSNLAEKTRQQKPKSQNRPRQLPATEIVACDVCSVHLPRTEALTSGHGIYCSDAHRRQAED